MDTEPIQIDSDDSFDAGAPTSSHTMDRKSIIEKYQKLKEESKKLDDLAVEVRSLFMICKQMEECYTKRIDRIVATYGEIRYLHDGTILLLVTIHNITNQPMIDWVISINPTSIFPNSSSSCCQTINVGSLLPGIRKTFQCQLTCKDPPVLLQLSLLRTYQLGGIVKCFKVKLDPILVTAWNQAQRVERKNMETSFTSTIRLPNSLINLLSGSPDTVISVPQVFKSILNVPNVQEDHIVMCIPSTSSDNILVKASCAKDGTSYHTLTIGTESSRSLTFLAEQLRLHLIVEMSKLKSRPAKGILILTEMDALSVEELFQTMLAAFN
nr:hypothetical protein C33F10.4 - Caenorhabditis elegans [Caenorhabditis elegans]